MLRMVLRLLLAPALVVVALSLLLAGASLAAQFLDNPGLNNPATFQDTGRVWRTFNEKVADGWWYYYVAEGTNEASSGAHKLHWMSSQQFAQAFGGLDYYREGNAAQVIWSSYDFDAGIYQQVGGLTIGKDYAFEVGVASYWRGSGYPITNGKMKKCIGVDPYGGTNPAASTVIWDWEGCDSTDKTWPYLDMAATARAITMTVFVRIQSPDNQSPNHTDLNYVYIDDGRLTLAPTVTLTAPSVSDASVDIQWGVTIDPAWTLQGVEVQYKDHADGVWHTVQENTDTGTSYVLAGQPGHIYTIRARAWQKQGSYDLHGLWVEKQVQVGGAFAGYVRNHFGAGVSGADISAGGSHVTSDSGGFYALQPPAYGQVYAVAASGGSYGSPPPISASVAGQTSVTSITFTLKPADDAITNGDFESDTSGWNKSGAGSATRFSSGQRSGQASLRLTGPVTMAQSVALSNVYNPTLSFWHNLADGASLEVSLSQGGTPLATKVLAANSGGWQHAWLPLGVSEAYTGSLTVSFYVAGGQASLDEVSLGKGPYTTFLPIIQY